MVAFLNLCLNLYKEFRRKCVFPEPEKLINRVHSCPQTKILGTPLALTCGNISQCLNYVVVLQGRSQLLKSGPAM